MKLLLAEDEKTLAMALREILTMHKYSVDVVFNGQDALDYINCTNYDGIIMDIMMPKIDGIQVLKTIRKNANVTPVLLLTAKSEVDDKVLGLESGANDYLTKPFATKELIARIRAMTRTGNEILQKNLIYSNIELDTRKYKLFCGEKYVDLTNKEYQLIEMLLRNVGRHISSEYFMEQIWGYNCESEINVVWANISSVRKKLEQINANAIIKSSRNLGYTLEKKHGK